MAGTLRGNAENMFGLNTGENEGKYASFDDLDSDSDGRDDLENEDLKEESQTEEVEKQLHDHTENTN